MKVNLEDPDSFTLENVRKLIASKDDSEHRQIRVTKTGVAFLSDEVGNINTDGLAFRLETFSAGNGYTGEEASKDEDWVKRVYKALSDNWPESRFGSYVDVF
ncbi:MAG: hypothetical protein CMQ34_11745 [Gammaproteobacteria bacterium]|nr:hypothetical protein [Gammaproteobacteria bacterium]|tara:strand:- start:676 stop:981 length:306 start_codon:yes stop_codon:yes gene_type:complete